MALLFIESFDHFVTADLLEKWSTASGTPTISAGTGRRGSASLHITATPTFALKGVAASGPTAIMGVAVKPTTLIATRILGINDGVAARDHFQLMLAADGSLGAYRGGGVNAGNTTNTLLGATAAGLLTAGVTYFVEVKVLISATVGTVTVRVNGATVLTLTGQNTSNGGTTVWSNIWLGSSGATITLDFDDLYVGDGTGAAPWNDFLGDCRVDVRLPTAAGATTGWTPSAGANWAAVDDAAPNDDTDYTAATAAGVTDTFTVQDAPVVGAAIYGVQHCISVKKTDAGTASIAPVIRHSGTDNVGANLNPGTTYAYVLQMAALNPGTSAAWTEAGFNAAEFGYKRTV